MSLGCSVNDAVNVLPCSTCAYLNATLSRPVLPFQDDAGFPAGIRLRIWWVLPFFSAQHGPSPDGLTTAARRMELIEWVVCWPRMAAFYCLGGDR
jgi:hypothetical protein